MRQKEYHNASEREKVEILSNVMQLWIEEGLIKRNHYYNAKEGIFYFEDAQGYSRGVMIRDFKENVNKGENL